MRGRVLAAPSADASGVISGDDGRRYRFGSADVRGTSIQVGREVDFETQLDEAREIYPVPGQPPFLAPAVSDALKQRDWVAFYLSWQGRVGRRDYWLYGVLAIFVVNLVLGLIPVIGQILTLATAWSGIVLAIKRSHDVDRSGWWTLVPAAPLPPLFMGIVMTAASRDGSAGLILAVISGLAMLGLSIWVIVVILARAGDPGPNRFGSPPVAVS